MWGWHQGRGRQRRGSCSAPLLEPLSPHGRPSIFHLSRKLLTPAAFAVLSLLRMLQLLLGLLTGRVPTSPQDGSSASRVPLNGPQCPVTSHVRPVKACWSSPDPEAEELEHGSWKAVASSPRVHPGFPVHGTDSSGVLQEMEKLHLEPQFWLPGGGSCTEVFAEKDSELNGTESWHQLGCSPKCGTRKGAPGLADGLPCA